ncbi:MAG TPA: alpha/beta hydrolase [Jatrophihabitans sp.]
MPRVAVHRVAGTVISADRTVIAFDRCGTGPGVVLVHGALTDRTHPTLAGVADVLAQWFTVFNYDRRGRGDSSDNQPYSVERELDDLAAVIAAAGGTALLFGGSSGAALVLEASARNPAIEKLAVWEPPYHVNEAAPRLPLDLAARLARLVEEGRRSDAVELFMSAATQVPAHALQGMRSDPFWAATEALAHTLAYEAAVMGPGNVLPVERLAAITQPTLVLNGADSPAWMTDAGVAVAAAIPNAVRRVLADQNHNVTPEALGPELLEFFIAASR